MMNATMAQQMAEKDGFIAALDQSGGSTPKALKLYGVAEDAYSRMTRRCSRQIHAMRARIIKSPAFTGEKVIGAILFERTMDGEIDGIPTADYLWQKRGIVPFLKVDQGLMDEDNGVQLMKPIKGLDALLERAVPKNIFGTKMRSVINAADKGGIEAVVAQQFEIGQADPRPRADADHRAGGQHQDRRQGPGGRACCWQLDSAATSTRLSAERSAGDAETVAAHQVPNLYKPLVDDPRVMRVVALSGGYSRDEANRLLSANERGHRLVLARPDRGPVPRPVGCRIRCNACRHNRQHLRGFPQGGKSSPGQPRPDRTLFQPAVATAAGFFLQ
jgi:fructose-bisphosphate aldolase class I